MAPYKGIKLHNLMDYQATEEDLQKGRQQFMKYGEDYVPPAIMAWAYQQYVINDNAFIFLFTRKNIYNLPTKLLTPKQKEYRSDLITTMIEALDQWYRGEKVTANYEERQKWVNVADSFAGNGHMVRRRVPTPKEVRTENQRKKVARDRFYADLKAKRSGDGITQRCPNPGCD